MLTGRSHGWGCVNHVAQLPSSVGHPSALLGSPGRLLPCHSHDGRGGGEDVVNSVSFLWLGDSISTQLCY